MRRIRCSWGIQQRARSFRKDMTEAEDLLWNALRNRKFNGLKFRRQYAIGSYILDFYCPEAKLAIELDGGHHASEDQREYDQVRTEYLGAKEIHVLRFWNNEIVENIDSVLATIEKSCPCPLN